jgi:hypothetical protein
MTIYVIYDLCIQVLVPVLVPVDCCQHVETPGRCLWRLEGSSGRWPCGVSGVTSRLSSPSDTLGDASRLTSESDSKEGNKWVGSDVGARYEAFAVTDVVFMRSCLTLVSGGVKNVM